MRFEIAGLSEIGLIGRDERQAATIGKVQQLRLHVAFRTQTVALELDIQPVAVETLERCEARARLLRPALRQGAVQGAVGPAGQRDQLLGVGGQRVERQMRLVALLDVEKGARGEPHQIAIARLGLGQQHDIGETVVSRRDCAALAVAEVDAELCACDRLEAGLGRLLRKFQGREEIIGVGDSERGLEVAHREINQLAERKRALAQRIGGVEVKMHKAGFGGRHGRRPWGTRGGSGRSLQFRAPSRNSSRAAVPR